MMVPVTQLAWSEAKYATALAMSSGFPPLPIGWEVLIKAFICCIKLSDKVVLIKRNFQLITSVVGSTPIALKTSRSIGVSTPAGLWRKRKILYYTFGTRAWAVNYEILDVVDSHAVRSQF